MFVFKPTALGYIALLATLLFPKEDPSWVVNVPDSPVFLEARMRGAYLVKNTSGKEIVSFTLGCVATKKDKTLVVMRLPQKDFSIDPGGSIGESIIDAPYTVPYEQCVIKSKAKLAVVSVTFADKTSWSFSESERGSGTKHLGM